MNEYSDVPISTRIENGDEYNSVGVQPIIGTRKKSRSPAR